MAASVGNRAPAVLRRREQRRFSSANDDEVAGSKARDARAAPTNSDPRNIYKVGLNTTRLLMALGDVICAWLLLRGAKVALDRLNAELTPAEKAFYEGKAGSGRWFARTVLPKLAAERAIAEATDLAIMDLDEAAY